MKMKSLNIGMMVTLVFAIHTVGNTLNRTQNVCTNLDAFTFTFSTTLCHSFGFLHKIKKPIYILYDVNPSEGFNLRRDVYVRLIVFLKYMQQSQVFRDVKLVMPPFRRLYHWKSKHIDQDLVLWRHFFDISSMNKYFPVTDFDEFIEEINCLGYDNNIQLNFVYQLQQFKEMLENGVFREKFEIQNCDKSDQHKNFFGLQYTNLRCLKFQGSALLLEKVLRITLKNITTSTMSPYPIKILFVNTEIVLHDHWGSTEFWKARRSMRFSYYLQTIADNFRANYLNSTNKVDLVQRPYNWMNEKPFRGARGGDYLCVHLRRGDFVRGREQTTPTLKSAAMQIKVKLQKLQLKTVFISSDCTQFEFKNLKSHLQRYHVIRFTPESLEEKYEIKDGGIAIIDQSICSHARHFIGTYESTFTYRIYEEREILGFSQLSTFNTLCKNEDLSNCSTNSIWPIQY